MTSCGTAPYDVPHPVQGSVRDIASGLRTSGGLGTARLQHSCELDHCPLTHGMNTPAPALNRALLDSNCWTQLGLAWAFLPDKPGLRNGLIFVGLARCIAMVRLSFFPPCLDPLFPEWNTNNAFVSQVLIWTGLAGGDQQYCAILVAVNSLLQMVLYAPLAILFVNIIGHGGHNAVSYSVVARSVGVFLGIPLGAAIVTRFSIRAINAPWYERTFIKWISPWSLIGLLYTILVLFASQGKQVVHQIVSVVRVAAPLICYFVVIFSVTLLVTARLGFGYKLAATQSFTAASNNFELAIAVAVATFGADSDEALASTVGPLIEVPVLIALVYLVKWVARRWGWKD